MHALAHALPADREAAGQHDVHGSRRQLGPGCSSASIPSALVFLIDCEVRGAVRLARHADRHGVAARVDVRMRRTARASKSTPALGALSFLLHAAFAFLLAAFAADFLTSFFEDLVAVFLTVAFLAAFLGAAFFAFFGAFFFVEAFAAFLTEVGARLATAFLAFRAIV